MADEPVGTVNGDKIDVARVKADFAILKRLVHDSRLVFLDSAASSQKPRQVLGAMDRLGVRGGVYIGGGIVPRLGDFFDRSAFRTRFEAKGRFSAYLAAIPSWVITAENPALRGVAAALA